MERIKSIYDTWSKEQSDNQEIKKSWCEIMEYLYEHCPETIQEDIATYIISYSRQTDQQAFLAGFQQAFLLWLEIMSIIR